MLFYPKELVQPTTKGLPRNDLQIFAATRLPAGCVDAYRSLLQTWCCDNATIHGVRYVWTPGDRWWVRYFWCVVVVSALCGCIGMYTILAERHSEQQLKTVVQTAQWPIYNIEFPAVAICPWNRVNQVRFPLAEERFLPPQPDAETRAAFRDLLISLEQLDFGRLEQLSYVAARKGFLTSIDSISVTELAQFVALRCDELFAECSFDGTVQDCCKLFVAERTEKGVCLVFNSLISEESRKKKIADAFYPWKIGKAGEGSGLSFVLRFNQTFQRLNNKTPFSMSLMIKESQQWSEAMFHILYPNTQNHVSIRPQFTQTSSNTRRMMPAHRGCLFKDEKSKDYYKVADLPYNRLNCITECQQRHLMRVCNCTVPLFFPVSDKSRRECRVSDFICIYENRDMFSYIKVPEQDKYIKDPRRGLTCNCIDSCNSLVYLFEMNVRKLRNTTGPPHIKCNIHYGNRVMTKYETKLEYTWMDLAANFGGILGLLLGASSFSLVEILSLIMHCGFMLFNDRRVIWAKLFPNRAAFNQQQKTN